MEPAARPADGPAGPASTQTAGHRGVLQERREGAFQLRPRSTTLIWPLSSDTTTATASVSSVIPRAARWRVP